MASTSGLPAAERKRLDAQLAELTEAAERWRGTTAASRAALMRALHESIGAVAADWVDAASRMKQIPRGSSLEGEEWQSGPYVVLWGVRTLGDTLDRLANGLSPLDGETLGEAIGGRVTVRALPRTRAEATVLNGFSAEVWLPPGATAAEARANAGLGSRAPAEGGGVGLVLGAGNQTAIPVLDVLYELVAGNRVAVLKVNPVMDDMTDVFQRALAPLVDAGLLRIVHGGGDVGEYLAQHPSVDHVHMTGSITTHNAIVFGQGEEGAKRRTAGTPILHKPITSELGGVSPIIVVPGRWTRADLRFQAEHVATMRLHNGGYNCIAGQTVLLSSDWPQRDEFLRELHVAMRAAPPRPPWYPGGADRVADALRQHPEAEDVGHGRVIIDDPPGTDSTDVERTEFFAPILGVVELPGDAASFLDGAVDRANGDFAGTLGANVIADPATMRALGRRFEGAIARLRYGTVTINTWTGVAFGIPAAPWGAFPGNRLSDVGSGIGVVHNALLIARPEKTVLRGPFRPFPRSVARGEGSLFPKPPWFADARTAAETGRRMVEYERDRTPARLAAILTAAFRA